MVDDKTLIDAYNSVYNKLCKRYGDVGETAAAIGAKAVSDMLEYEGGYEAAMRYAGRVPALRGLAESYEAEIRELEAERDRANRLAEASERAIASAKGALR